MSKPVMEDLFTFSGRRNRQSYFFYILLTIPVAFAIALLSAITAGVGLILLIPLIISAWAIGGQRCRDFGWTGWAVLLTVIPFLGVIFAFAMLFIPGGVGDNRYGPDPLDGTSASIHNRS